MIATPPADLRRGRLGMALTVFTLLFIGLEARLFYLQILRGEDFRERARISVISRERIPARRGEIRDREGRVLARNVPAYRIRVTPHYVLRADREEVLGRLASIVGLSADERLELDEAIDQAVADNEVWEPIALGRELVADTCPVDASPLELRDEVERSFVCPQDGDVFEPIDPKATYCPHDRTRLKWTSDAHEVARCTRCKRRFLTRPQCPDHDTPLQVVDHNLRCPLCKRTYTNEVAALQAQLYELPGVEIDTHFRRDYPMQYDAAHLVGYMNRVTAADRERWPGVYGLQDVIGRSGVERALEEELRGERGESLSIKDAGGHRATSADAQVLAGEAEFARAVPGLDVWLTLDMQLQKEVRKAFRYYASGAAVVVDPRTGDVLAAYSKPGFDPNELTGGVDPVRWAEIRDNPYAPLMNKALTPFAPGSVYKIVTGLAALVESIVSPDVTIDCTGYYEYKGRRFHCHNREGHGPMDLVGAFVHSCDVYFYRVGEMLGIDRLATYGRAFGFGEPTGVEVSERTGLVPTRRWHAEETALGWQPGFTLSTAIGQGSLTASPLQVARAFAAVANGGNLLQLHLVSKLVDEHGNVVHQSTPQVVGRLPGTPEQLSIIREALVRVVNDPNGTARDVALQSIVIAGKTGTAEAAQVRSGVSAEMAAWLKEDHAWFAAYAPAEDPQVVVVTFVEHGGSGSRMAGPIAQRIISSWMRLGRYKSQDPDAHEEVPADDELPPADEPQEAP
ncbi:MAG: penicillin-binding protein 2 [Deltaproteobacteria bacterium]|nr:penicillin-binding protein 2 [Deltaproteobacteria bacterium]MCB9788184.1 penicillin-binding protein 2 [Deltaproteobacteria bacterium]